MRGDTTVEAETDRGLLVENIINWIGHSDEEKVEGDK